MFSFNKVDIVLLEIISFDFPLPRRKQLYNFATIIKKTLVWKQNRIFFDNTRL